MEELSQISYLKICGYIRELTILFPILKSVNRIVSVQVLSTVDSLLYLSSAIFGGDILNLNLLTTL